MTTLLLIRHGETEWNRRGRWQGQTDIPLSAEGRAQARRLAQRLRSERQHVDHLYTSDLGRAYETAAIIAQALDLPAHPLIEMREIHIGGWSGLTSAEVRARFPRNWEQYEAGKDFRRGEHGETMAEFQARTGRAIDDLIARHPGERLMIVSHGGTIRAILHHFAASGGHVHDMPVDNASITEIHIVDGVAILARANDGKHLETPALSTQGIA
jgi:broad specificity phosphatase PhoE